MEAYTDFASVYDTFMDEAPYEEWAAYLCACMEQYGISRPAGKAAGRAAGRAGKAEETQQSERLESEAKMESESESEEILRSERNLVLDLGCGTGTLTRLLAKQGYDMIGVDNASAMLTIAMQKSEEEGLSSLYLLQDMRGLELYSTVGTVISVCDSLNYILEETELLETFRLVNNYLYPGGLFLFDFNTVYKYEQVIGDATIAENREECSFIWENYYDGETQVNEYDLTVFVREQDGRFSRFQETHYQRGYTLSKMKELIERAGLAFLKAVDADTRQEVSASSERIYILARECTKQDL